MTRFTRASRRRLLKTIGKLNRNVLPVFATLTYPGKYSTDPEDWKRDLKVWGDRLERQYPDSGFVWRLEFQKRGAPHYHLLIYGVGDDIVSFREWLSVSWFKVVGSENPDHLAAGTNAQPMRAARGAMYYAAKEMGKTTQARILGKYPEGVGRWWGIRFKNRLPWSNNQTLQISETQANGLIRLMRKHASLKSRDYFSLSVFCNGPFWTERIDALLALFEGETQPIPGRPLAHLRSQEERIAVKRHNVMISQQKI
ncbi:MAG: hypothetical protein AAFN44_07715 [Pseudomonadota bacterium]